MNDKDNGLVLGTVYLEDDQSFEDLPSPNSVEVAIWVNFTPVEWSGQYPFGLSKR